MSFNKNIRIFDREITICLISSVVTGLFLGSISLYYNFNEINATNFLLFVLLAGLVAWFLFSKRTRAFRYGIEDYYIGGKLKNISKQMREDLQYRYNYLGITGNTRIKKIAEWIKNDTDAEKDYFFLLLHPEAEEYYKDRCKFKNKDFNPDLFSGYQGKKQAEIKDTIKILTGTPAHKNKRMQIKFYRGYPTCWIEIFDDKDILYGFLFREIDGMDSPGMLVVKKDQEASLFKFLQESYWKRLWESGADAVEYAKRKGWIAT